MVVKIVPCPVLLSSCVFSNLIEKKPRDPGGAQADSDRQNRRLTPSSVSIALNSLHFIRCRPGTGDRQRAPVTSLQRQASFFLLLPLNTVRSSTLGFTRHHPGKHHSMYNTALRFEDLNNKFVKAILFSKIISYVVVMGNVCSSQWCTFHKTLT